MVERIFPIELNLKNILEFFFSFQEKILVSFQACQIQRCIVIVFFRWKVQHFVILLGFPTDVLLMFFLSVRWMFVSKGKMPFQNEISKYLFSVSCNKMVKLFQLKLFTNLESRFPFYLYGGIGVVIVAPSPPAIVQNLSSEKLMTFNISNPFTGQP